MRVRRVGREVAADRPQAAVVADQSVERIAALWTLVQMLLECGQLGGRQPILGQQP